MTGHQGRSKSSLTGALPHQLKKQIVKFPLKSLAYINMLFITAPSDKERQQLTKSRRATVASSKPSEARTTKTASASSDVDSSEAEANAKVGRKTPSRHGSKTAAAAAASPASSLSTAIVSLEACIIFISPMVVLFHSVVLFAPVTVIRSSYASIRPSPSHHLSSVVIIWRMRESYHNCSVLCCV